MAGETRRHRGSRTGETREDEIKTKKEGTMPPEEKGRKRE